VSMTVNNPDNTHHGGIDLVIDGVGKLPQENASESTANQRVALWSFIDQRERDVHCIEETLSGRRRMLAIPGEGSIDVGSRDLANAEPSHLPELP